MIKKLILLSTASITSFLLFYSCSKESETGKFNKTDNKNFSITEAKDWFSNHTTQQSNPGLAKKNYKKNSTFYPQWNNAIVTGDKNYEIVECPLKFDAHPGFIISTNDKVNNTIHGITRLLILKNKKSGTIQSAFMHIYSTSGSDDFTITYSNKGAHFSGFIFFTDSYGEFINGWQYNDGVITKQCKRKLPKNNISSKAPLPPPEDDCETLEIRWYEQDCDYFSDGSSQCTDWFYIGSTYETYCSSGGGGGYSGEDNKDKQKIIPDTSITKHEKVNCVYQNLMSPTLNSCLKHILSSFDDNNVYNVTFKIEDLYVTGSTNYLGNNNFLIRIDASDAYDNEYSRIWLASTFIHEAFHAQLRQKALELLGTAEIQNWPKNIDDMTLSELATYFQQSAESTGVWNSIGHDWMLNHLNEMTNAIKEFTQTYYPTTYTDMLTYPNAYKALALMGLSESIFYSEVAATIGDASTIQSLRRYLAGAGTENCTH